MHAGVNVRHGLASTWTTMGSNQSVVHRVCTLLVWHRHASRPRDENRGRHQVVNQRSRQSTGARLQCVVSGHSQRSRWVANTMRLATLAAFGVPCQHLAQRWSRLSLHAIYHLRWWNRNIVTISADPIQCDRSARVRHRETPMHVRYASTNGYYHHCHVAGIVFRPPRCVPAAAACGSPPFA